MHFAAGPCVLRRACRRLAASAVLAALLGAAPAGAVDDGLTELSLQDLAQLSVTSVSRRPEPVRRAAAAVHVITGDAIRRSGARTLPEALRLVPGLHVARVDARNWAISARGFNSPSADKLEVLIDGRTLYSPMFSGVYWDQQGYLLDDIERIEIIRGPGGTLWGANAVNGVINIITRPATQTLEPLLAVHGGAGQRFRADARLAHGDQSGAFRLYATGYAEDSTVNAEDGSRTGDQWNQTRAGLRADRAGFSLHVDGYDGSQAAGEFENGIQGRSILLRKRFGGVSGDRNVFAGYWDSLRRDIGGSIADDRRTWNLDFQRRELVASPHELIWGVTARRSEDSLRNGDNQFFDPTERDVHTWGGYIQGEARIGADWRLIAGTKVEHNDFTGVEVQPNLRAAWHVDTRGTLWFAVSRAVRTPNRSDHDSRVFGASGNVEDDIFTDLIGQPIEPSSGDGEPSIVLLGNPELRSEALLAWEGGLRWRFGASMTLDLALFWNDYEDLRGIEPREDGAAVISNSLRGRSTGAELLVQWQPANRTRVDLGLSLLDMDLRPKPGSGDESAPERSARDPEGQAWLSFDWQGERVGVHAAVRHVGALRSRDVAAYTELDLALSWQLVEGVAFRLSGQSLLEPRHVEFDSGDFHRGIERSVRAGLVLSGL